MAERLEEGLWPWTDRCPACWPGPRVDDTRGQPLPLRLVLDGVEVFEVEVVLCHQHAMQVMAANADVRGRVRERVTRALGERWDRHMKPAMDAIVIAAGGDPLPRWKAVRVAWPDEDVIADA